MKKQLWTGPVKLFVPAVGDALRLEADWTFKLVQERRNSSLMDVFGIEWRARSPEYRSSGYPRDDVTLPKGTVLAVDRVYVRSDKSGWGDSSKFNSLTFLVRSCPDKRVKGRVRFWASLSDVNRIECSYHVGGLKQPEAASVDATADVAVGDMVSIDIVAHNKFRNRIRWYGAKAEAKLCRYVMAVTADTVVTVHPRLRREEWSRGPFFVRRQPKDLRKWVLSRLKTEFWFSRLREAARRDEVVTETVEAIERGSFKGVVVPHWAAWQ